MISVYLAGPIEGVVLEQALLWRSNIIKKFERDFPGKVHFYNPMRGKENIVGPGKIICKKHYRLKGNSFVGNPDVIFATDMMSIDHSDLMFVNLTHRPASGPLIGTMFEIGRAHALQIPTIVVSPEPGILNHPFISRSSVCFSEINDGYEYLRYLVMGQ